MASFSNHSVSNIVDEWMKDDGGLLPTATAAPAATSSVDLSSSKGRGGLGFENKGTVQEGSRVKNDALLDKLKKSNKRKRDDEKQQVTSAPLTHGLAEEDEELESRIKLVSTLGKKPEAEVKKGAPPQPKKEKAASAAPPAAKTVQETPVAVTSQPKKNAPAAQAPQQRQSQPEKEAVVPSSSSEAAAPSTSTEYNADGGDFTAVKKRKRIKTRSKQKNIRRDNRPDDQKPAHLKFGKGYMGRPITPQTKERLGQK
eukprot:gene9518-6821_t